MIRFIVRAIARRQQARRDTVCLSSLSDHQLADLGITRADLEGFARFSR